VRQKPALSIPLSVMDAAVAGELRESENLILCQSPLPTELEARLYVADYFESSPTTAA
jgi:hypothetical protein